MNDYVDPIVAHVEAVRKWPIMMDGEESKPLFILGHSMGGLITLFTIFKKETLFKVYTYY
jgi:predicted alpha/beta superfamily hydrolase